MVTLSNEPKMTNVRKFCPISQNPKFKKFHPT